MPSALEMFVTMREDLSATDLTVLKREVRAHYEGLLAAQKKNELVAIDLGEMLCTRLEGLLAMAHLLDTERRADVVGAARYFIFSADEKPDDLSCTGLDDDVEIFNHVAKLLARPDLVITD